MNNTNGHNRSPQKKRKKKPQKSIYYLIVPFYFNRGEFSFQKKGQWTVLDLLILRALSIKNYTLDELVDYTNLNKKLLVQIIIPFLKLKWVTLIQQDNKITLHCTDVGRKRSLMDELPVNNKSYVRTRDYLGNMFTSEYIGLTVNKDINYYTKSQIIEFSRGKENQFFWLDKYKKIPQNNNIIEYSKIEKFVTFPNEDYLKPIKPACFFEQTKYLIFTFKISEIQNRLSIETYFYQNYSISSQDLTRKYFYNNTFIDFLKKEFEYIYNFKKENKSNNNQDSYRSIETNNLDNLIEFKIPRDTFEVIYGGDKHRNIFFDVINNARNYLIIQSTFIGQWMLEEIRDSLLSASKRDVKITILLGKDDYNFDDPNLKKFIVFFDELNKASNGLISLHETQTGSHSKTIICEHKEHGHIALVGSCNWLYTNFNRFEVSVIFYNAEVVKKIIEINSILALGKYQSVPSSLNIELRELSDRIKINKGSIKNLVSIHIVYKNKHSHYVEQAKDATHRVYLISDKFNKTVHRSIWDVLKKIPDDKKFKFFAYYSSDNKEYKLTHQAIKEYGEELLKLNPNLKLYQDTSKRRNHAKILAWDSDNLLITSLNWLSADATINESSFEKYHEIGIYIKQENIVDDFIANWEKYGK
ncbi:hypothetical protein B6D17_09655 [Gilliamella apis]|uniref:phospholipase D-like domain-containing protein n=1 Tax=Gilliamella apis TaxID=1970738 RepID=UPI000A32F489|nr:phospholipase D-like domain-containing protein [Gilliamella apis]OTQ69910.1 hypothetical protein B6D17_09655 [Gilliamella apis]OTQ76476.1 hypothetical protein B6C90_02575 [Gilliamella apis]